MIMQPTRGLARFRRLRTLIPERPADPSLSYADVPELFRGGRYRICVEHGEVGQLAGLGPQVALVTTYTTQPIVAQMRGSAVGFPLSRSLEIKNGDKTTVEKMFDSSSSSLATSNLSSPEVSVADPNNKKGPLTIAAAGSYNTGKPNSQGRFVVTGSSTWAANRFLGFNGNGDLASNTVNWLSSDEDLISIRPKPQDDRRVTMTRAQLILVRAISQFVLPLMVVIAGTLVWWKRR